MTVVSHSNKALDALGQRDANLNAGENAVVEFGSLLKLYETIDADGSSPIHAGFREVLCRLIEVALLRDSEIVRLVDLWATFSAEAPEFIRNRILKLTGFVPSENTVRHISSIVGGSAAQRGRRVVKYENYLPELFSRQSASHPRKELRCTVCGYHFTRSDLNGKRALIADDCQLVFAESPHRNRLSDRMKPLFIERIDPNKPEKVQRNPLTGLTIDHVVPEEGLGWAGPDNLEIVCNFCNFGKLAFRWSLEPISMFGAGGFADYPADRALNRLGQTTVVSTIRYSGGRCSSCGDTRTNNELTVRSAQSVNEYRARGFSPWNLETVCYDCY